MGDIGSASFDRVNDAIPIGRAAALAHRAELERYAVPEAEYLAWRESASLPGREKVTLAGVNLNGVERANPEFIRQTFGLQTGDVVDARQIAERANAVFALSDFERVGYYLRGTRRSRPWTCICRRNPGVRTSCASTSASRSARTGTPRSRSAATTCRPGSTTVAANCTDRCASAEHPAWRLRSTSHSMRRIAGSSSRG